MVVQAPRESLQLMFLLREEDQAVSGRWRSITRAQLRPSSDSWTEDLMSGLLSVLIIAGWSTREPHQQDQVERHLPSIFKAVQDLRKALGEDVPSMDMEWSSSILARLSALRTWKMGTGDRKSTRLNSSHSSPSRMPSSA